mgnify:FL=1
MKRCLGLACVVLVGLVTSTLQAEGPRGYFRYPSVHGQTVVFTGEGDLWTVSLSGGRATRLTTHLTQEPTRGSRPMVDWSPSRRPTRGLARST